MELITSIHNQYVKYANSLLQKKHRDETGRFIIEGEKFVADIPAETEIELLILSESCYKNGFVASAQRTVIISDFLYRKISDTKTPQGVMAVCAKPETVLDSCLAKKGCYIVLDKLSDSGNVGTIVRSAAAAGFSGVIALSGTADIYSPKSLRASASSVFRIDIVSDCDPAVFFSKCEMIGIKTYAADMKCASNLFEEHFSHSCAVIVGNEGNGVSEYVLDRASSAVFIPMADGIESLNAAVAASIVIFEIKRKLGGI